MANPKGRKSVAKPRARKAAEATPPETRQVNGVGVSVDSTPAQTAVQKGVPEALDSDKLDLAFAPREGPRAKQFGLAETQVVRLEPATFPDGCEWLRSKDGLLFGIAVGKEAVISYGPVPIPQHRIAKTRIVVELAALELGTLCEVRLIFLGSDGKPYAIKTDGKLRCDGGPRCVFNVPIEMLNRIFTSAVLITPASPDKRPIVRTAWLEIDG